MPIKAYLTKEAQAREYLPGRSLRAGYKGDPRDYMGGSMAGWRKFWHGFTTPFRWIGKVAAPIWKIAKPLVSFLPGGSAITGAVDSIANAFDTGQNLYNTGKSAVDAIRGASSQMKPANFMETFKSPAFRQKISEMTQPYVKKLGDAAMPYAQRMGPAAPYMQRAISQAQQSIPQAIAGPAPAPAPAPAPTGSGMRRTGARRIHIRLS